MKHEHKEAWLKALRSGSYQQCTEVLHNGKGYCCLGVLADILDKQFKPFCMENGITINKYITDMSISTQERNTFKTLYPVSNIIGLSRVTQDTLINMNDGDGDRSLAYFHEIANWIEKNIPSELGEKG